MPEENDMVEIQLNSPHLAAHQAGGGKEATNYFGNLRFTRSLNRRGGFPYGQCDSEVEDEPKLAHKYSTFSGKQWTKLTAAKPTKGAPAPAATAAPASSPPAIGCIRQMYCPDCQQRLDVESVRHERFSLCCLPIIPLVHRLQACCAAGGPIGRKVVCHKCGTNLGYWKYS